MYSRLQVLGGTFRGLIHAFLNSFCSVGYFSGGGDRISGGSRWNITLLEANMLGNYIDAIITYFTM